MSDEIRELTDRDFARAIPRRQRERILSGKIAGGDDIVALRRFVGLTQQQFAQALAISVHTLRNWEQGRRTPEGPALALLRIAARHPRVLQENLSEWSESVPQVRPYHRPSLPPVSSSPVSLPSVSSSPVSLSPVSLSAHARSSSARRAGGVPVVCLGGRGDAALTVGAVRVRDVCCDVCVTVRDVC